MIFQRKEWKIVKWPDKKGNYYLIRRKIIRKGITHNDESQIPAKDVKEIQIYKARTH